VLTAGAGVTVALRLPAIYKATATVLVEPGRAAAVAGDLESRLQVISQEILSRSRLETVIREQNLYPAVRQRASMEAAVARMRRDVQTEPKILAQPGGFGATVAIAVSYRGPHPPVAARGANALASLYLGQERKLRERQASGTTQALKTQLDELQKTLQQQEASLGDFQEAHAGELPQQSEATLARLEQLHASLRTATEERLRAIDRRNE